MDSAVAEMKAEAPSAPVAEYVDAREYKVMQLDLPSTGEPVNVIASTWSAAMK